LTGGSTLGTTHYLFDGRGRLTYVGTTSPGSCNTLTATYNGMGERVKEAGSKTYLYAGPGFRLNPNAVAWGQEYWIEIEALGERDRPGAVAGAGRFLDRGLGFGGLRAIPGLGGGGSPPPPVSGTAAFRWVISDAMGSSLVEIDNTGTIVARSANPPFGKIAEQWGSSGGVTGTSGLGARIYYAGHDRQTDSGLVYMNARWIDPGSGGASVSIR